MRLTIRQQAVLDYLHTHQQAHGMPPTRAEIASALGFRSANAAEGHLRALAKKGALALATGVSRGIRLADTTGIPVIGRVAAGHPVVSEAHIERYCQIDPQIFRPRADYLLKVEGRSMEGAGIHSGDLLAVHRTQVVRDGQIAVVRVNDEVTVKRVYRQAQRLELRPEHPDYSSWWIDPARESLVIEGLGVGVLRAWGDVP